MALNHRLTVVGSDIHDNNLDLKVHLKDYAGAPVEREGAGDTLGIEWGAEAKQLPLIYGSAATVRFKCENNYEFLDLFAQNARDVYIEAYENDVLTWAGFGEAEKWAEPLIDAPYEVSLTAYDGLGLLDKEDFANADKTPITGEKTIIEILAIIFNKTGLALPFNTAVNIRPSTEASTADALTQYKIDAELYTGLTCYEVLEQLFKNVRIQQRGGEWYIIANNLFKNATITVNRYTSAGTANGTKDINTRVTGFTFEDEPTLEPSGGLKQLTIKQNFGYVENVLDNADFSEFDGANFENWTAYGGILPEQRVLNADGDRFLYIPGREKVSAWRTDVRTKYLLCDPIPVAAASDLFNIKITYALMGNNGEAAGVFIGIRLIGTSGTEYALSPYIDTTDGHRLAYQWEETAGVYNIPMKAYMKHAENWFFKDDYYVQYENIEAHPFDEISDNFKTESINATNGLPESGTIKIYLFAADSSRAGVAGACFSNIEMFLTDENADEFATENKRTLINSLDNNYVPDDIELINGDAPAVANRLLIYDGQFINAATGEATNLWTVDGTAAAYTYAELMARLMASDIRRTYQTYKAILANVNPGPVVVFEDTDNLNPGKYFIEAGIKYNFRMATIEGRFVELLDLNLDSYTLVEEITTTTAATGTKAKNKPATVLAADEKVKLINPDSFDILGQPGYLSVEYFDQIIDSITGRAHIYPYNIKLDTTNFNNILSASEDTAQKAFEILNAILPPGGNTNQVLKKLNGNDFATYWADESGGGTVITGNATITETPTGLINGTNKIFITSQTPSAGTARIYLNGIRQHPGTHYSITGDTITFINAPFTGDLLLVDYHAESITTVYGETPTGLINGTNKTYIAAATPATIKVYLNGIRQHPGTHYSITGDTITFINAPFTGDLLLVDYEI